MVVVPSLGGLILLESSPDDLTTCFIFALVGTLAFLGPLSKLVADYLVMRELREVEHFCLQLKGGDYSVHFDLPPEKDEERDILALKRNLNWMAHVISRRELDLHQKLEITHHDRSKYQEMSMLDPLTGLFNRRGLEAGMNQMAQDGLTADLPLTLMFLDADKFKSVNDQFGHQAGDELLMTLAQIIRDNVREQNDIAFRFGGDEFGVLFSGIGVDKAEEVGRRILSAYNKSRIGETTLSIGIAGFNSSGQGIEPDMSRLLRAADQAAYTAKNMGGDRIFISDNHKEK